MKNTISRRSFMAGSAVLGLGSIVRVQQSQPPAALLEDLTAAYRVLAQEGVLDGFGHVSARHSLSPSRFIMSRSLAPELVTSGDLLEFDFDGNALNAAGRALYSERFIHAEIYRARSDVRAIVHAHAPSLIPFGVTDVPLRPVYHMAAFIGSGVPIFDIRKQFGGTDMLVSDAPKGQALARTLGDKTCVLMRGHGVVVVGSTIPIAVGRSIYLELNARIQTQAMALSKNVTYLDAEEARRVMDAGENRGYERPWELWKMKAMGK